MLMLSDEQDSLYGGEWKEGREESYKSVKMDYPRCPDGSILVGSKH